MPRLIRLTLRHRIARHHNAVMWPDAEKTQDLLAAAKQQDREAVEQLFDRFRGPVRNFVQLRLDKKLQRRVDVSDIIQDVLIEANRRLQDYLVDPKMPFRLWIRQIAKDRIIDSHRRHRASAKRSIDREQPLAFNVDQSTMELAAQICDPELTPAAEAMKRELGRIVEQAIETLGEQDQEVICMRRHEKLTNKEIAHALKLSEQAAAMRYKRAVDRLRGIILEQSTKPTD